ALHVGPVAAEELNIRPGSVGPDRHVADAERAVPEPRVVEPLRAEELVDVARDVRMVTGAERARSVVEVLRRRPDRQSVVEQRVLDPEPQRERIARLGVQYVLEDDPRLLALDRLPARPADEPVDR